jgi:2-hydroxychromene-2-carboxylate isomerase
MTKSIDYYFTPVSPYSYFGHDRLVAMAAMHGAAIRMKPIDLGKVFPVSGGLPLKQRSTQRQAYRLFELERWRARLGVPFNAQPKFAAAGPELSARWCVAALEVGTTPALAFAGAVMRARWAEERDIADPSTLAACAAASGLDADTIANRAQTPEIGARYDAFTREAIDAQVFGAPWYVVDGEPFWGQDRLDFLDRKLAQ